MERCFGTKGPLAPSGVRCRSVMHACRLNLETRPIWGSAVHKGNRRRNGTGSSGTASAVARTNTAGIVLEYEENPRGERVKLRRDGWAFWQFEHEKWGSHKVHYIEAGDPTNPRKIVLLHGFGASAYHMRWNIPHLSREFHVLCPEMLGFGWSDKPVIDYSGGEVWVDQMEAFLRDKKAEGAVVVGNSLGGYVMLALAAHHPELVSGVVLVNSAGSFKADLKQEEKQQGPPGPLEPVSTWLKEQVQRLVLRLSFLFAKQPQRIRSVLQAVYVNHDALDDELVDSIRWPADDPNAAEVFRRIITQKKRPVDELLEELERPALVLWGMKDPWMIPRRAEEILECYPRADRVNLMSGGHCPHDDCPEEFNRELSRWAASVIKAPTAAPLS